MGFRRIAKNHKLRVACVLGTIALLTSGCTGWAVGHFHNPSGDWISFAVVCTSPGNTNCNGSGNGILGGKRFVVRTAFADDYPVCGSDPYCVGGSTDGHGTASWGKGSAIFTFSAYDAYPSPDDTLDLTVTPAVGLPQSYSFSCSNNCFRLVYTFD